MSDTSQLELRVAALETRLVRLRVISLMAFAVAAGALAWGLMERKDRISEGRLWVAKDSGGRVRAMFGVTNDAVGLTMYDSTGQMRVDLGIAPGGFPGLLLFSKTGEAIAALNMTDATPPTLRLTNPATRQRVELAPVPRDSSTTAKD